MTPSFKVACQLAALVCFLVAAITSRFAPTYAWAPSFFLSLGLAFLTLAALFGGP